MIYLWLTIGAMALFTCVQYGRTAVHIWRLHNRFVRDPRYPLDQWMAYAVALPAEERAPVIRAIMQREFTFGLKLAFLQWRRTQQRTRVQPPKRAPLHTGPGVYVLTDGQYYKIGQSGNVQARVQGLNTANPIDLIVHCVFWCDNPAALERELHERFATRRMRREWFALNTADLAALAHLHEQASIAEVVKQKHNQ